MCLPLALLGAGSKPFLGSKARLIFWLNPRLVFKPLFNDVSSDFPHAHSWYSVNCFCPFRLTFISTRHHSCNVLVFYSCPSLVLKEQQQHHVITFQNAGSLHSPFLLWSCQWTTVACSIQTWIPCQPSLSLVVYCRMLMLTLNTKHTASLKYVNTKWQLTGCRTLIPHWAN